MLRQPDPRDTMLQRPLHVLVVDDDQIIRQTVAEALADEGYRVSMAAHGAEALQMIEGEHPDVILLDMRMPVMDGWQFAAAYRQRPDARARLIAFTAAVDARRPAKEIQADACVSKPFDLDDLLSTLERQASRAHRWAA